MKIFITHNTNKCDTSKSLDELKTDNYNNLLQLFENQIINRFELKGPVPDKKQQNKFTEHFMWFWK